MNSMQVKYFLTLCSEKSFSKAAQKLYVTQPSFSQFIKKTEADIGTELIDRSCTPIRLTEAGETFYKACQQFAAIEDDMLNSISGLSELKSGRLTVGTTSFRASTMLAKSISAFKKEYPGVEISITEGHLKTLENAVASGEIEIMICSGNTDENIFHCEPLADEHLYAAVCPDSPINERMKKYKLEYTDIAGNSLKMLKTPRCSISEFADEPFISLRHGEGMTEIINRIFAEAMIKPKVVFDAQNLYTAFSFAMEGMGFTFLPNTFIKYGNIRDHLNYYAIDSDYADSSIRLITRKNRYLSRAAEEYSKILKQLIQNGTWRI